MFGAGAAAVGAGVAGTVAARSSPAAAQDVYAFYGDHQSGILTPAQDRLHFAAFDVTTDRAGLIALLSRWTTACAQLTRGEPVGATATAYDAPPDDTGEAMDLPPAGLTITFGFGPSLFERFGLRSARPEALVDLPHFPGDNLDPARSGGDLCVQACSDDPQVAVHAVRNLSRLAFGAAVVRWSQLGYGRTSATSTAQHTPRNLFGFKDGTANVKAEDPASAAQVWVQPGDGPDWMTGGSYLVARRIRMNLETWDRASLREQEAVIGRTKREGAPLSGGEELDSPDFSLAGADGQPVIPRTSHVAMAHPDNNNGAVMLRRGYNFVDGNDNLGRLDAGLFFISYQRDPRTSFIPVQRRLARQDALGEYLQHVGSAIFAVPPGVSNGQYVGQMLLG
jgi:deferrochelatase/peroxidase EfeB